MFIELAEALDCPDCREGTGLVAFVGEAERRRVRSGHLGCPLCEREVPIAGGTIRLDLAGESSSESRSGVESEPSASRKPEATPPASDSGLALRIAALLGLGDRGALIWLGPGVARHAPGLITLGRRVEVIASLGPDPDGPEAVGAGAWSSELREAGLNPIVGVNPSRWPVRAGSMDGVALGDAVPASIAEAARALRSGGRLVLIGATEGVLHGLEGRFEELASDEHTWVGVRA